MFDSFVSLISNLNIFDLRQPVRFRFCSFQGFAFYILSYMLVVKYDELFDKQTCITALATGWKEIPKGCGLTTGAVFLPFLYMVLAFTLINLVRRVNWSADAVFNNLSLLILAEAVTNAGIYQIPYATIRIQSYPTCYFLFLSLLVVVILAIMSVVGERRTRLEKGTFMAGFRASPGIFQLLTMYVLLSAAFYVPLVKLASG